MRLQDKVVIVTGAGSGMGLAMVNLFAREGATLIAADWNGARLDAAVAAISDAGGAIVGVQGDISDQATAEGLVERALTDHGRLDVLINNAGIMDYMAGVGELTDEIWTKVLAVNLNGPMYTMRKAAPAMVAAGKGSIVNIASTAAVSGGAAGAAYTTSKHGLLGLTKNTAWMYAQKGVRCNAICPGGTATNIAETMPQDKLDIAGATRAGAFGALIPAFLSPDDIAYLALFLASDESVHINGAVITADAGWKAV
jgi:NAD(P)-dependent dehydrogenase (short-subunit alcohol dehydrogenase family)